ncbi:ABC transporter permease [Agromyces atrinae]|uniref:Peptide/nickel transport system permease protein n=1 Tax=Agromyces atrinae TaxID=592376 RepID=A0A852SFJ9_9MICO|nr:ABC transporter permease [Agromyces atrinae]NYD67690.1 peptide/nickel transport system permease protein [Agromyces atrinae]
MAGRRPMWSMLVRRPAFVISAVVVLAWVIVAVGWRSFGVEPFADSGVRLAPPGAEHWFGTDRIGRDVFARVLAGAESALLVGPLGTALAAALGTVLGLIAGYHRGWLDQLITRAFDAFVAIPAVIFLIVIVGAFGSRPGVLILAIGVLFTPGIARVVRAEVLVEMGKDYVTSAEVQGERSARVLWAEILPNVWPQVVVQATLSLGAAVFVAASLSFLGLAAAPPSADWGLAVNENRAYLQGAPWTLAFPALALASLVVSVALIGDALTEVVRR